MPMILVMAIWLTADRIGSSRYPLYITGTEIAALLTDGKAKTEKEIVDYVTDTMKKRGVSVHMHIFRSVSDMAARVADLSDRTEPVPEELAEFWRIVLV